MTMKHTMMAATMVVIGAAATGCNAIEDAASSDAAALAADAHHNGWGSWRERREHRAEERRERRAEERREHRREQRAEERREHRRGDHVPWWRRIARWW